MNYSIDKRFFNDLFFDIYNFYEKDYKRFCINYGGAGSGKSFTQAQLEIIKLLTEKTTCLVIRKFASTLRGSVTNLIIQQLESWNIPYNYNKTDRIITLENGSSFIFKGVDDGANKIKSIVFAGKQRVWIEEADQLFFEDFKQINLRLRGPGSEKAVITLTFNPVSKKSWIYKHFFEKGDLENTVYFHTTYKNNRFIDDGYANELESYKLFDENMYDVYCLGKFGHIKTGTECYKFDLAQNTVLQKKYAYNKDKTLYLTFDENVKPYLSLLICQLFDDVLVVVDEICVKGENLEGVCKLFAKKYIDHSTEVVVTGDPSSRKGDSKLEKGYDFYKLVRDYLHKETIICKLKVQPKAESVFIRISVINKLLFEKKIIINEKCNELLSDIQEVIWDETGVNKDKKYITENVGGEKIRYQKNGHTTDALEYLCCLIFDREMKSFKSQKSKLKVEAFSQHEDLSY